MNDSFIDTILSLILFEFDLFFYFEFDLFFYFEFDLFFYAVPVPVPCNIFMIF
jgi:hypothetical protein